MSVIFLEDNDDAVFPVLYLGDLDPDRTEVFFNEIQQLVSLPLVEMAVDVVVKHGTREGRALHRREQALRTFARLAGECRRGTSTSRRLRKEED